MRRAARPLLYGGTISIVVVLGRIHAEFIGRYLFHSSERLPWSVAYAFVFCMAAYSAGLPDVPPDKSVIAPALGAAMLSAVLISVAQLLFGSLALPRFVVVFSAVLSVPWFTGCSLLARIGRTRLEDRDRVIAVVAEHEGEAVRRELRDSPERPAFLVTTLTPRQAVGGISEPLLAAAVRLRATVVVLDREAQASDSILRQAATLHENGVRIRTLTMFYDQWLGKLPLAELERLSLLFDIGELHRPMYGRLKRVVDVSIALGGLAILLPTIIIVVFMNAFANRGPLFYQQPRIGRNSCIFAILKFRTMRAGSEGAEWTELKDPRVTSFGRVLRKTHLDELPQVVNILRGDLSVVGPRPEQPHYVKRLRQDIPFYDLRHQVRPGLTGWAQVKFNYGASDSDAWEKLQYEFYYLQHQNVYLDARIIGRTVRHVVGRSGR